MPTFSYRTAAEYLDMPMQRMVGLVAQGKISPLRNSGSKTFSEKELNRYKAKTIKELKPDYQGRPQQHIEMIGAPAWQVEALGKKNQEAEKRRNAKAEQKRQRPDIQSVKTAVYRLYDNNDVLLYVGISLSVLERAMQHRQSKTWFDQVVNIKIQWLKNRAEAQAIEKAVIKTEKPIHNVIHNANNH